MSEHALCLYPGCEEPSVLVVTTESRTHDPARAQFLHQEYCLAHVGPRASEILHGSPFVSVTIERIWEDVVAEAP